MLKEGIFAIGDFLESRGKAIDSEIENNKDIFSLQEMALYKACPRKYYFASVHVGSFEERLSETPTIVGKLTHESIRLFHENAGHNINDKEEAKKLAESLLDKLIPCYASTKALSTDKEEYNLSSEELKEKSMALLNKYLESELSQREPWMQEAEVNVKFDGNETTKAFFVRGFADRVDKDSSGSIRIIDFKTREFSEDAHNSYKRQLALYRIAANRGVLGEMGCLNFPSSYIAYLNPKGLDLREIEPNLDNFERDATKVVAAIRKEQKWPAKITDDCQTCPFKELCQ